MLSERQSHRTPVHHLDDLLLGVASSHRALEEGSQLVLGERISGLKQGSKCIHFLVHGVMVMVLLVLGVLSISLALRHAAFSPCPCPCSVMGLAIWVHRGELLA